MSHTTQLTIYTTMTSRYSLVRWEADVGFRLERWFAGHSAKPRHQTPHQHACAFPIAVLQCSSSCCCRYGVVTRPRSYISYSWVVTSHGLCGDWWHRPYASVLLEMERVVVRRCNNTSFPGHTQCLLHCTDCSHQVVRGSSELLRGTVYQAARPRSCAA